MLSYGVNEEICADMPFFRFVPANKEIVQRLIIRAAQAKNDKDFINMLKWKTNILKLL